MAANAIKLNILFALTCPNAAVSGIVNVNANVDASVCTAQARITAYCEKKQKNNRDDC